MFRESTRCIDRISDFTKPSQRLAGNDPVIESLSTLLCSEKMECFVGQLLIS